MEHLSPLRDSICTAASRENNIKDPVFSNLFTFSCAPIIKPGILRCHNTRDMPDSQDLVPTGTKLAGHNQGDEIPALFPAFFKTGSDNVTIWIILGFTIMIPRGDPLVVSLCAGYPQLSKMILYFHSNGLSSGFYFRSFPTNI
jgi:hypothetical protein